jgi:hypothetical protein
VDAQPTAPSRHRSYQTFGCQMPSSALLKQITGAVLVALPAPVLASDPTPLFVFFIAIPLGVISIFIAVICYFYPKFGCNSSVVFLIALVPITIWASNVGYLESAGIGLNFAWLISIVAFFFSQKRLAEKNQQVEK